MGQIGLFANYGYYDDHTDSRANLYNVVNYIHGSPKNNPPIPGYFSFLTVQAVANNAPHLFITLACANLINKSFKVSLNISLQGFDISQTANFYVHLNPDNVSNAYNLKPIPKIKTDSVLSFDVSAPTTTGVYYISIYCVLNAVEEFSVYDLAITY